MLTSTTSKIIYDIEGITTPIATGYEIPFRIFSADDVVVNIAYDTGETPEVTTGWSVQIPKEATGTPKVVFDSGYTFPDGAMKLVISRSISPEQDVDLRNGDAVDAEVLEEMFDKLTGISQELKEELARAFKLPISENPEDLSFPAAAQRSRKVIGFDTDGETLMMFSNPDDAIADANEALEEANTTKAAAEAAQAAAEEARGKAEDAQAAAEQAKTDTQQIADDAEETIGNSNSTGLRGDAIEAINETLASALASIGESDSTGARGDAIQSIAQALSNALASIGQTDTAGARGDAIAAISVALTAALAAIGTDNDEGARQAALQAISAALQSALTSIGQSNNAGARGDAIAAITAALSSALASIGETDAAGARGEAISSIESKAESVNAALDAKLSAANQQIDQKVTAAESAKSDAESAKTAAETARTDAEAAEQKAEAWAEKTDGPVEGSGDNARYSAKYWAELAQQVANIGQANATTAGILKLYGDLTGSNTDGTATQKAIKEQFDAVASSISATNQNVSNLAGRMDTAEGNITTLQSDLETAESDISSLQDDMGTAQDDITALEQAVENINSSVMLPIPELDYKIYGSGDHGILKIANNWTGYSSVTVRIKLGGDPSASDAAVPAEGYDITSNGTYYVRAFPGTGATNQPSPSAILVVEGLKCQKPKFSYNQDTHTVTLTPVTSGSSIRYTTNGDEPTESSTLYSGPFTVQVSCTVKAKAFKTGLLQSDTVSGEAQVAKIYGVMWNRNQSSTKLTRLTPDNDPYNLVNEVINVEPTPAYSATAQGSSPLDDVMPWAGMRMRNIIDGVLGAWEDEEGFSLSTADVMVYCPEMYFFIMYVVAEKKWYFYVADGFAEGMQRHPFSEKYLARYFTDTSYESKTGTSANTQHLDTHRDNAAAKGTGWHQQGLDGRSYVNLVYIVEYADWDTQQIIGNGNTDAQSVNGGTDAMVYHTGINGSTCQYRHLENLWGYYEWIDGILLQSGKVYICTDYTKFSNTITEDYVEFGGTISSDISGNWITDFEYDEDYSWLFWIPSEASGGSGSTFVPDIAYRYTSATVYGLYVGNFGGGGSFSGLFYFYGINAPGGNLNGSRLVFEPQAA